ncbi:cyclic AMP-dependent transcription factor ATF-4 [Lampris incognitus]|uniref:cyclic AMP-dependent transcription factor ATF-4 n=1 Tax=Lampris incognitus TaxID=2546036 RepID=UPI0024B4A7D1|nr:cyclic AMP-dependent transcription factor ATF-4 [Lampris incognitus]
MALSSHLVLEDVGDLFLGPSFMMADPMGPLLDQDEEEALSPSSSLERKAAASPSLSFSSYATSPSPYQSLSSSPLSSSSPPPSPPTYPFVGTKAETYSTPFSWLGAGDLLRTPDGADDKDDAFSGMDWMVEKIDLNDLDLDSLIGSCASDESPSSPEELLASLDSHMDLDLDSFDAAIPTQHTVLELDLPLPDLPPLPLELSSSRETEVKLLEVACDGDTMVKSEPSSPTPSPCPSVSPSSPASTLELGSEVDVQEADKAIPSVTATVVPDPSGHIQTTAPIVLSLSPSTHLVVVLAPKDEPTFVPLPSPTVSASPPSSACDSDSGFESAAGSPPHLSSSPPSPSASTSPLSASAGSSRTKPYSKPEPVSPSPSPKASRVKSVSGTPKVVEKKLKKMEQNKTAATRYRQKKRVEQEVLNSECSELEKRNHELAERAESISREIKYLKDLMEEVRNAKNRRGKTCTVA